MAPHSTCLGAVRVWTPVALATIVWLLPGLGCRVRVKPETALTRISMMDTLSSVTENADSPNTASMARGDSTCGDKSGFSFYFIAPPHDRGAPFKENSFIVFLKLIKAVTGQFQTEVLGAGVCSAGCVCQYLSVSHRVGTYKKIEAIRQQAAAAVSGGTSLPSK